MGKKKGKKVKITYEGQPCRKCGTPVVKNSHNEPSHSNVKYWFKYWFSCPNCKTKYMVQSARVNHISEEIKKRLLRTEQELDEQVEQFMERARESLSNSRNPTKIHINYYEYINSLEWMKKSGEAKRRAGYKCQVCNRSNSETVLHTHHRTYERLGAEREQDLIVLCRECHRIFHENRRIKQN